MATTPFIRDVPAAEALAAWSAACAAAGCPGRVDAVRMGLHAAVGRVTAEPVWATGLDAGSEVDVTLYG